MEFTKSDKSYLESTYCKPHKKTSKHLLQYRLYTIGAQLLILTKTNKIKVSAKPKSSGLNSPTFQSRKRYE